MKIFGYKDEYNGMTCGVIIADSIEEAKEIFNYDIWKGNIFEIPFEKGFTFIGNSYDLEVTKNQ